MQRIRSFGEDALCKSTFDITLHHTYQSSYYAANISQQNKTSNTATLTFLCRARPLDTEERRVFGDLGTALSFKATSTYGKMQTDT